MRTNKPSLHYLYSKFRHSYKNLENRGRDMKLLDFFKPQLETIIAHTLFITHCNVKLRQYNQTYCTKNQEKFSKTTAI